MFVPLGFLAGDNSTFYLHCNVTALSLNFVINSLTFLINAVDSKRHASQSLCISSVTADSDGHYMLGELFLRNVRLAFECQGQQFVACTKAVLRILKESKSSLTCTTNYEERLVLF